MNSRNFTVAIILAASISSGFGAQDERARIVPTPLPLEFGALKLSPLVSFTSHKIDEATSSETITDEAKFCKGVLIGRFTDAVKTVSAIDQNGPASSMIRDVVAKSLAVHALNISIDDHTAAGNNLEKLTSATVSMEYQGHRSIFGTEARDLSVSVDAFPKVALNFTGSVVYREPKNAETSSFRCVVSKPEEIVNALNEAIHVGNYYKEAKSSYKTASLETDQAWTAGKLEELKASLEDSRATANSCAGTLAQTKNAFELYKTDSAKAQQQMTDRAIVLDGEVQNQRATLEEMTASLQSLSHEKGGLSAQLKTLQSQVAALTTDNERMTDLIAKGTALVKEAEAKAAAKRAAAAKLRKKQSR